MEGARCVFGLKETEQAAPGERGGGQGEETWNGLVTKQHQRTKRTPLTRLPPSFTKILTVLTSVCVALLLCYASVSLCPHTQFSFPHTHIHTGLFQRLSDESYMFV